MDTRIEEFLSSVEGKAASVYTGLIGGTVPAAGTQERADFATFLGLMYARTPTMRRMSGEMLGRGIQIMAYAYGSNEKAFHDLNRRVEKSGGRVLTAAEKERLRQGFIDPSGFIVQVAKERTLHVLGVADKLAPLFFHMKWSLLAAEHGFFVTSDNPIVKEVDPKSISPFYGDGGFVNKTGEITLPLSPKLLLLMSWNPAPRLASLSRELVQLVNKARAAHSDRYLYAHIRHKYIQQLAAEFKDIRPGMKTSGFGPKNFAEVKLMRRLPK